MNLSPGVQNNRKAIGDNLKATFNLLLNILRQRLPMVTDEDSLEDRRSDDKRNKRKTSVYKVKRTSFRSCNHKVYIL